MNLSDVCRLQVFDLKSDFHDHFGCSKENCVISVSCRHVTYSSFVEVHSNDVTGYLDFVLDRKNIFGN